MNAQSTVQSIVTSIVDSGSGSVRSGAVQTASATGINVTYNGLELKIDSMTVSGSQTYVPTVGGVAIARRNSGSSGFPAPNTNQSTAWNTTVGNPSTNPTTGSSRTVNGVYRNTMEALFTSQDLHTGTENLFVNTAGAGDVVSNVERMDFVFAAGSTVAVDNGFAVFERGAQGGAGANGGFKVALITGIDGNNVPTGFSDTIITVTAGSYSPSTPFLPPASYDVYRYATQGGPDLNYLHNANIAAQGIAGVVFSTASFGVALGEDFYGYAVFGLDVTATNGAQLLDWTNATYFPTNSGTGNDVDMVATGAALYTAIPEPSTIALVALCGAGMLLRRRR